MLKGIFVRERDVRAILSALDSIKAALSRDEEADRPLTEDTQGLPSGEPKTRDRSASNEARLEAARQHVDAVRAGKSQRLFRPQPRSRPPQPRYADFAVALMEGTRGFSLAELEEEMSRYVELNGNTRTARATLRFALNRDSRFAKTGRGEYQVIEEGATQ